MAVAQSALENTPVFEAFLQRLGPKDRLNVERHLAACDAETTPHHARLWRRLAAVLMGLAPHAAKLNGRQSLQFYIADGKYRMQVFAMEDLMDGKISIYCADVREQAGKAGVLTKNRAAEQRTLVGIADAAEGLDIEPLSARSAGVSPFFKDMLGWNRTAIRVILPIQAVEAQILAAERLCAISALKWLDRPASAGKS